MNSSSYYPPRRSWLGRVRCESRGLARKLRGVFLEHWILPVRIADQVIVIHRRADIQSCKVGDRLAYRIDGHERQVTIGRGVDLGEIIARPGDHVRITPRFVLVNEVGQLRRSHMPRTAEFNLAQKQWFLWPHLAINNPTVPEASVAAAWLQTGMIDETQILGRPFRHWFGWPQFIP